MSPLLAHKADIAVVLRDVCFWGKADVAFLGRMSAFDPKQTSVLWKIRSFRSIFVLRLPAK
jgi:hypothetical protein